MRDPNLPPRELWPDFVRSLPALGYPETLNVAEVLLGAAGAPGDRIALMYRGESVTYAALRARVLALAAALTHIGVAPADRVAFRLPNSPDFIALWLAIQWIGAIGVPIPPAYRRREIAHMVNDSGAAFLFAAEDLAGDVDAARAALDHGVRIESSATGAPDDIRNSGAAAPPPFATPRERPALITYVSSASGAMKGAVQSPATILAPADTYARDVLRLTPADVCVGSMSMALAFGLGALLVFPLRFGATTALQDGTLPFLPSRGASQRTVFFGVPTLYRILLQQLAASGADMAAPHCCVSAAEPLPAGVAGEWRARTGLDLLDGLGTTELSHIFVSARPGDVRPGVIGTAVPGYEVRIVDESFRDCPEGVEGRLVVRGPTGCLYWRNAEAQRSAVRHGWSLTGDVCVRRAGGWIQHLRRDDDLIVSGGYKISAAEVRQVLEEHPAVSSAQVSASADPVRGAVVTARVVPAFGVEPAGLADVLQQHLKREIASFKCPRWIQVSGLTSHVSALRVET